MEVAAGTGATALCSSTIKGYTVSVQAYIQYTLSGLVCAHIQTWDGNWNAVPLFPVLIPYHRGMLYMRGSSLVTRTNETDISQYCELCNMCINAN